MRVLPRGFCASCRVERAGITPIDKGRAIGGSPLPKTLQASSAVKKPALGQGALFPVIAKHGKIIPGEPSSVVDDKRMHMAVRRVVIVDSGHKLDGVA